MTMMPLLCRCITRCKKLRSHFEFHGLSLRGLQSNWWKTCCNQLTSLVLYNCDVNSKTLENIIVHCCTLRTLNIRPCEERTYSDSLLDHLIAQKVERTTLVSLNLYAIDVSEEWYRKLFIIYPNIRTLSRESIKARGMTFPTNVDNFSYWAKSNCLWMMPLYRNPKTRSFKFRALDISLDLLVGTLKSISIIVDFFSNQCDLEKIELAIFTDNSRRKELKTLLFFVIRRLPKLKKFALRGIDFHLSSSEFNEFLSSIHRLESFEYFNTLHTPQPVQPLQPPTSVCNKMTKLQLPFYKDGLQEDHAEEICLAILSPCYFLQYLSLGFITEKILNRTFKVHIGLRALFLNFYGSFCNSAGMKCPVASDENPTNLNIEYTIGQLKNLEHLEIRGLTNADAFEPLLSEFEFPKLKCFHFTSRIEDKDPEARTSFGHRLLAVVSLFRAPYLECLEIRFGISSTYHVILSMKELRKCCKELKNLRFLLIDSLFETSEKNGFLDEAKQLLIECPSLNYITHGQNTFTYDRFSGKLKMYPCSFLKIPCCKPSNFQ